MPRSSATKTVTVSESVHRQFKAWCAQQGRPINDAADEALREKMNGSHKRKRSTTQ